MKRAVPYILLFAVVIVAWGVFAQQQKTLTSAAPTQTTAPIESQSATPAGR
jgi:hypothetical protein